LTSAPDCRRERRRFSFRSCTAAITGSGGILDVKHHVYTSSDVLETPYANFYLRRTRQALEKVLGRETQSREFSSSEMAMRVPGGLRQPELENYTVRAAGTHRQTSYGTHRHTYTSHRHSEWRILSAFLSFLPPFWEISRLQKIW
jgi:hypothetical protein